MQPVLFSVKEARSGRPYWRRVGSDICYFKNKFKPSSGGGGSGDEPNYMTASFTVNFPHSGDICYLAYHYPYSYTKLMTSLDGLREKTANSSDIYCQVETLTQTLCNHDVPIVTITAKQSVKVSSELDRILMQQCGYST